LNGQSDENARFGDAPRGMLSMKLAILYRRAGLSG
jgi:hypothetical protein